MTARIANTAHYIRQLIGVALRSAMQDRRAFFILNLFMLIQNLLFFAIWIVFFATFSSLRGWQLEDLATLYGMASFAFGTAFLFCGGTMDIGRMIAEGELDVHLGRPRHPLYALILRESRLSGLGDMATGPVLWLWLGGYALVDLIPLFGLGLLAAVVILATTLVINSLPFFVSQTNRMTDRITECFIMLSSFPHNGLGIWAKILLLTVFPAGFIVLVPVTVMRESDWLLMGGMALAAAFYAYLAVSLFNYGLRRYTSGNRMADLR